uniref:Uncharacterized protein n=1 Tax=Anopheles albimanus TaxID=7167 RepID=A0A182FTC8_ANOAL
MLEPNVSASMSSVAVAYTLPAFTRAAHWASASHGASTYGTPINRSSSFASFACCFVTFTSRRLNFSMSSTAPASVALSSAFCASSRRSARLFSSPLFSSGGFPSNTYTGLIPFSSSRMRTVLHRRSTAKAP